MSNDSGPSAKDVLCGLAIFAALRNARRRMAATISSTTSSVATTKVTVVAVCLHAASRLLPYWLLSLREKQQKSS